jgi:hypothetical protein
MKLLLVLIFCLLSLPGFGQEDDSLSEATSHTPEAVPNISDELQKLGHNSVDGAVLLDDKALELIKKALKNNPLQNSKPEEVRKLILDKYEGKPIGKFLEKSPRVLDTFVDILRYKKALSSLVGIFSRKEELRIYMYFWLGLLIGTWLFKKYIVKEKSFLKSIIISIFTSLLSLLVFYSMFYDELSPTVNIIAKHISK